MGTACPDFVEKLSRHNFCGIDNIDSITRIGDLLRDQYTVIHSMADCSCWPMMDSLSGATCWGSISTRVVVYTYQKQNARVKIRRVYTASATIWRLFQCTRQHKRGIKWHYFEVTDLLG